MVQTMTGLRMQELQRGQVLQENLQRLQDLALQMHLMEYLVH